MPPHTPVSGVGLSPAGLVDVVSGSFGAGHDAAADAIIARLSSEGYATRCSDIVAFMRGPLGRSLRAAYRRQVQSAPAVYRSLLRHANRGEGVNDVIVRVMRHTGDGLLELAADRPTVIISTHPFASQALGDLRASGRLRVPVVTYLTDMSVHRAWVHRGIDLHLALHRLPARQAETLGARLARVVRPAVPAAYASVSPSARRRAACRQALGLPQTGRLIAVTGGSLGMGALERSAAEIAATGLGVPIVVCGRNRRLRRRLCGNRSVIGLDWVEDMPTLLGAVDGVVQNSGGFMSLEALAAGVPVITYRCIAGHGETNAAALDRAGLVPWVRDRDGLAPGLLAALAETRRDPWAGAAQQLDVVAAIFPESSAA